MLLLAAWVGAIALVFGATDKSAAKTPPYYTLSSPQRPILTDCSGAAYRPESKTWFVIENRMGNVFEINAAKRILNMYPTGLCKDTEGICYAENGIFYACGEAENGIYELELKDGKFHRKRTARLAELGKPDNNGLEGIAWCKPRNSVFCVKERKPCLIIEVDLADGAFGKIKQKAEITSVRDLAGLAYDPKSGCLLALSQEDRRVLTMDPATLKEIGGGFPVSGRQPEGAAVSADGTLCIISEPTYCLFYKLGKPGDAPAAKAAKRRPAPKPTSPDRPLKIQTPLLAMSFDSSLNAEVGPKPTQGTYALVAGKKGKAVDLTSGKTALFVQADGVLDGNDLIADFWFKPAWSTADKRTRELLRIQAAKGAFMLLEYNANSGALAVEAHVASGGRMGMGAKADGLIRAGKWHHVVVGWKISGTGKIAGSLALDEVVLASRPYLRNWPKEGLDLTRCRVYVGSRGTRSIQAIVDEFTIGK